MGETSRRLLAAVAAAGLLVFGTACEGGVEGGIQESGDGIGDGLEEQSS